MFFPFILPFTFKTSVTIRTAGKQTFVSAQKETLFQGENIFRITKMFFEL